MGQGSGANKGSRTPSRAGSISARTSAGIGRLRNRAGTLTDLAGRARANRRRARPAARVR